MRLRHGYPIPLPSPPMRKPINPDVLGEAEPDAANPARQAWRRARAALALQLTSSEYDVLVEPVRFHSFEDGELKLLVPNSVARDLLGNRLRPWLKEHLAQLLGEYVDVHLVLDTNAPLEPVPDVTESLVAAGVYRSVAVRLVRDYGPDVCRAELDRHAHIEGGGGLVVESIRAAGDALRRQG